MNPTVPLSLPRPVGRFQLVALLVAAILLALGTAGLDGLASSPYLVGRLDPAGEAPSHHFSPGARAGELAVDDGRYRASLDRNGFTLDLAGGDRLGWSLRSVTRSSTTLTPRVGEWRAEASVASRPLGDGVRERLTAREGEVQWDVVLASPPAGSGPLRVDARLDGVRDVVADGRGVTLDLAKGSVRVGQLVVVDARGRELHRAVPDVVGDRLSLTVPAAVLDDAAYPLTLDPTISAERHVSPAPAIPSQQDADTASDGTNRIVVWDGVDSGISAIVATSVDAAGNPLEPNPLIAWVTDTPLSNPAITYMGGNFLVVWEEGPQGGAKLIRGRLISPGLELVGGDFIVAGTVASAETPAVAFDGTNALVAWTDRRNSTLDIFAARVDKSGTVLDAAGIPVVFATGHQLEPAVTFGGTRYTVVWTDGRAGTLPSSADIFGARVTTGGTVVDAFGFAIANRPEAESQPDIASNGDQSLVVWAHGGSNTTIRATRISGGTVLDATGLDLRSGTTAAQPKVAFNGTSYQAVWLRGPPNSLFGGRVATDGTVLDSTPKQVATGALDKPAIDAVGASLFVVWNNAFIAPDRGQVFGARMNVQGAVIDSGRLLSIREADQFAPATASDGSSQMIVWSDDRNNATSSTDIYATRVSASGAVRDPEGIRVSAGAAPDGMPAVAYGAGQYLVVWKVDPPGSNNADIFAQRVAPDGTLSGSAFKVGAEVVFVDQTEPAVSFDGTNFLVVWTDLFGATSPDIRGVRVSPSGGTVGINLTVSSAAGSQSAPSIAFDGTNSLVVWGDRRNATNDIFGARISTAGTVLDPAGIPIQTDSFTQFRPSVAFGGGTYLVAWDESGDIWGSRVATDGSVTDPGGIPISTAGDHQSSPSVAFNGAFLVAWEDRRSGTSYDMYATRVATDGTVRDPSGLPVSTGSTDELVAGLAKVSGGWGLSYQHPLGFGTGIYQRTISSK